MPTVLVTYRGRLPRYLPLRLWCRYYTQAAAGHPASADGEVKTEKPRMPWDSFKVKKPFVHPERKKDLETPAVTRFAPSPTGYLHAGSLRTALYNYLFAKATSGTFILRIEDTDKTRTIRDAEEKIMADLKWAGLEWDAGPDIGGLSGPYRQSQRLNIYSEAVDQLLNSGHAYRCFCSSKSVDSHKQEALDSGVAGVYPGTCRAISDAEARRRATNGEPYVVRFKSSPSKSFEDMAYGRYSAPHDEGDFIIVKTDGFPTYHFANVVDDHFMQVTHVIRGAEWLISTPKHIALYEAFGWTPPKFGHVGLLFTPENQKLSKRHGAVDLSFYRERLILPQALNNWLSLLGCSFRDLETKSEIHTEPDGLIKHFTAKFTTGNIVINPKKLKSFQTAHVRAMLNEEDAIRANTFLVGPLYRKIVRLEILRASTGFLPVAAGDQRTLDTSLLGDLVADLVTGEFAKKYLYKLLRLNEKRYDDGVGLLVEHPYLFWDVTDAAIRRSKQQIAELDQRREHRDADDPPLTREICALWIRYLEMMGEEDWTADVLSRVLVDEIAPQARQLAGSDSLWGLYSVLRLAMAGSCDAPTWQGTKLLSALGKAESLKRLRRVRRIMDEWGE